MAIVMFEGEAPLTFSVGHVLAGRRVVACEPHATGRSIGSVYGLGGTVHT